MITDPILHIILIMGMVAFAVWAAQTKFGKNLGPALIVIIIGIILHNVGLINAEGPVIELAAAYTIPVAICILMLSVDFKELKKLSVQPFLAMLLAVVSVCIMSIIGGALFAGKIDEGWKIAGMFVGTYTGGSNNLSAIAVGLNASGNTLAIANTADYVIGMPYLIFLFAVPAILKNWKWFQKVWPYHLEENELNIEGDAAEAGLLDAKVWSIFDVAALLTIGIATFYVSTVVSAMIFPESFASAGSLLMLTTIALVLAQLPVVKKLRGKMDLGMLLSLIFLCVVGFMVDLASFVGSALVATLMCVIVIIGSTVVHIILCRVFKIKYEYTLLSIVAGIADGPTSGLVAGSANWKSLVTVAIICGTLGDVFGNYLGIAVAYIVKLIVGA